MLMHGHDFLTISLVLDGFIQEQSEARRAIAHGGHVSIKPPHVLHGDAFLAKSTLISMQIYDPKWFGLDFREWNWLAPKQALLLFTNVIRSNDKKEALSRLQAHLLDSTERAEPGAPPWLGEVHRIVCRDFREPISIEELAKGIDKHPVYLTRVFKRVYGTDIKTYRDKLRMGYAFAERLNKKSSLTSIAYETGFADQSHFNRRFKAMFGESPRKMLSSMEV